MRLALPSYIHGDLPALEVVSSLVYVTADRSDDFLRTMVAQVGARAGDVVCFGHTHVPWVRVVDDVTMINTGSVGRPKDRDPRSS